MVIHLNRGLQLLCIMILVRDFQKPSATILKGIETPIIVMKRILSKETPRKIKIRIQTKTTTTTTYYPSDNHTKCLFNHPHILILNKLVCLRMQLTKVGWLQITWTAIYPWFTMIQVKTRISTWTLKKKKANKSPISLKTVQLPST